MSDLDWCSMCGELFTQDDGTAIGHVGMGKAAHIHHESCSIACPDCEQPVAAVIDLTR